MLHVHVVHHDGQAVERVAVAAADDHVADLAGVLAARAVHEVVPGQGALAGDPQPHGVEPGVGPVSGVPAAPVVGPLAPLGDGGLLALLEALPRAGAAVGPALRQQLLDHRPMPLHPLALAERPFVPVDAEPAEAVDHGGLGLGRGALAIGVLDAQHQTAAVTPGERPVEERRSRPSDVKKARRAGGEAGPDELHRRPSLSEAAASGPKPRLLSDSLATSWNH